MKLSKSKKVKKLTAHTVWPYISKEVRLRDCLLTTGTTEFGLCYTCGKRVPFNQSQAGHLIDGHTGLNYLDVRGIKLQCGQCNFYKYGNKQIYTPKFIQEYGQKLYDEILKEKEAHKWSQEELQVIKEAAQRNIKLFLSKESL